MITTQMPNVNFQIFSVGGYPLECILTGERDAVSVSDGARRLVTLRGVVTARGAGSRRRSGGGRRERVVEFYQTQKEYNIIVRPFASYAIVRRFNEILVEHDRIVVVAATVFSISVYTSFTRQKQSCDWKFSATGHCAYPKLDIPTIII